MKKFIKRLLPGFVFNKLKTYKEIVNLKLAYNYDYKRYIKYSNTSVVKTENQLLGLIIMDYHSIEKGLTMPKIKYNFGYERITRLIKNCNIYSNKNFNITNEQFIHAIGVILEYKKKHKDKNKPLDDKISLLIGEVESKFPDILPTNQKKFLKDDFWKFSQSSFLEFSQSRFSVRNFDGTEVSMSRIIEALKLSQNAPSACNRQTAKVYVYSNKEKIGQILDIQGGNTGFGYLTDKLIILTVDLSVFAKDYERYQGYIDGGIYAMNILYSLHYFEIGCCILNCSHSIEKDIKMREICNIPDSENFISMFSCGNIPNEFSVALSKRYNKNYSIKD